MNSPKILTRSHHALFAAILSLAICVASGATAQGSNRSIDVNAVGWDDVPKMLARIVPATFPDHDFTITTYGAKSDNATDIKSALDQSIAAGTARTYAISRWRT